MRKPNVSPKDSDSRDQTLTIGKRLRMWRKSSGLNLVGLSKLIHVSQGSLSDLENDNSLPSARTLANLCLFTDIEIYWLLTGVGSMVREKDMEGKKSELHDDWMFAMGDNKLRRYVKNLIRIYRHGEIKKLAHLEGFLVGADPNK